MAEEKLSEYHSKIQELTEAYRKAEPETQEAVLSLLEQTVDRLQSEITNHNLPEYSIRLIVFRKKSELSQEDVAAQTGLTVGTISRLERGEIKKPRNLTRKALAKFYDTTPEKLFGTPCFP